MLIDVILLAYGIAFAVLGAIIFAQLRATESSDFRLIEALSLLGWFALLHSVHEFLQLLIFLSGAENLAALSSIFLVLSFMLLLLFGLNLIEGYSSRRLTTAAPIILFALFITLPILVGPNDLENWNISSRYFLGFPGAALTAYALATIAHRSEEHIAVSAIVRRYLLVAAVFFAFYAASAGIITPAAPYFPARYFNVPSFFEFFGFPVQLLRALCAVGITFAMWHVVNLFNLERRAEREAINSELIAGRDKLEERVERRTRELKRSKAKLEHEIREHVRTESSLREANAKLDATFKHGPVAMAIGGTDGKFLQVNDAMVRFSGYSREELEKMSFQEISDPADVEGNLDQRRKAAAGEIDSFSIEKRYIRKDGETVWGALTSSVIRDDSGEPLYFIGQVEDITARKEAEEALKRSMLLSHSLNRINRLLHSSLDFNEILKGVLEESSHAIGCEAAAFIRKTGAEWELSQAWNLPESLIGLTASEGREGEEGASGQAAIVAAIGPRMTYSEALLTRDGLQGALDFYLLSNEGAFNNEQKDFIEKLAASVSLAIQNSSLYSTQREVADRLQEALLQIPTKIEGIEFGSLYRSASRGAKVGGDFYDLISLDERRTALVIGDVSGKGLEAATATSLVKNTIQAYLLEGHSPGVVLEKTSEVLRRNSHSAAVFVTAFLAVFDSEAGALTYASAGHPPAVVRRNDGSVVLLECKSPVLGALPSITCQEERRLFQPGEKILMYTDGVTEARRNKEFFGVEKLIEAVSTAPPASSPDQLCQHVFENLEDFCGGEFRDDIAILAMSY